MPRKKKSVDMYGKSWKAIDIPNLEKAVKLFERLNYLNDHFASSLAGQKAIMGQINEKIDIQNELKELGINLNKEECEQVIKVWKANSKVNDEIEDKTKLLSVQDHLSNTSSSSKLNISKSNFGAVVAGKAQERYANKVYTQISKDVMKKYKAHGSSLDSQGITEEINEKVAATLQGSAKKYDIAASGLQIAADTFSKAVNTFKDLFTSGFNAQRDTYHSTFTNLSVRTGLTRDQYLDKQANTNNELNDLGLGDNIAVADVQKMWDTLASKGFSSEQAFVMSIETVLTNTIVPYLNSSSEYFQQLVQQQPNLMKQVRGIGAATMEISGSSVFANKYLQEMIDQLGPISEQASTEIGIDYAKASGYYEELRKQGLSDSTIGQLSYSAREGVKDPSKLLTGGSLDQRIAFYDVFQHGDLNSFSDWAMAIGNANNTMSNWIGDSGNTNAVMQGVLARNQSIDYSAALEINRENVDFKAAEIAATKAGQIVEQKGEEKTQEFTQGKNQTKQELQEIKVGNLATDLAVVTEKMGYWYKVLETAINGIAGLVVTGLVGSVIGKGIGGLAGSGFGGTGSGILASAAGGAGGIAIATIAGAAAATLAGAFVADKMWSASGEYGEAKAQEELKGTNLENNSAASALLATANAQLDAGSFQKSFGNVGSGISMGFSNLFQGKADKNKNFLQWAIQSGAIDTGDKDKNLGYLFGLAMIYAQNGYLDAFNKGLAEAGMENMSIKSKDDIGAAIKELGISKDTMSLYISDLFRAGWARINTESGKTLELNDFKLDGSQFGLQGVLGYRLGLDSVPYDNYPAMLHEGEAVLTASTAAELRNLVAEYRAVNSQSINFDAIIQNQTNALVSKMDEIIRTMNTANMFSPNSVAEKLGFIDNMKHVRSTKTFG